MLGILDALYAGVLDESAWNHALLSITDLAGGSGCVLFATDPRTRTILRDQAYRIDLAAADSYRRHWIQKEIRLEPLLKVPVGQAAFDAMLLPRRTWLRSEIYNEFLRLTDTPWLLSYWLHKTPSKVASLCIQGSRRRGPFESQDGSRLQPLIPHLMRALEIKDRLERLKVRSAILAKNFDMLSFGVMVLDHMGRVLETNAAAQELTRTDPAIAMRPDGTIRLSEPAGTQLHQWILIDKIPHTNKEGLLHVRRPAARPLSLLVARLPRVEASWIGGDPCWMLLIFDPDRDVRAASDLIARDLGISNREAEIASLLVAGCSLPQIASQLRISVHTARNHLKAIYSKTSIQSQAELIRAIATGPSIIRSTSH